MLTSPRAGRFLVAADPDPPPHHGGDEDHVAAETDPVAIQRVSGPVARRGEGGRGHGVAWMVRDGRGETGCPAMRVVGLMSQGLRTTSEGQSATRVRTVCVSVRGSDRPHVGGDGQSRECGCRARGWHRSVPLEDRGDRVAERVGVDGDGPQPVVESRRVRVMAPGQVVARRDAVAWSPPAASPGFPWGSRPCSSGSAGQTCCCSPFTCCPPIRWTAAACSARRSGGSPAAS
jgi:hypothetical protein